MKNLMRDYLVDYDEEDILWSKIHKINLTVLKIFVEICLNSNIIL